LLGVTLLISLVSLSGQVCAVAGETGVLPASLLLNCARRDYPTWRRFLYFPTLLWLSTKNGMLRGLVLSGIVAACAIIYGGPWAPWAFAWCYVVYLSLDRAIGLVFPWDSMIFEAILFATLLPATHALPDLDAVSTPAPALAWMYRLLVFRVLLGFGKFKFVGSTKDDHGYLTGFLVNQPLVSPFGWHLQKAPLWALKALLWAMFLAEIPLPFLMLFPNQLGMLGGAAIVGLMIGIWLCGSFGYFNVLVMAVCVTALDTTTPRQLDFGVLLDPSGPWLVSWFVLLHTLAGCIVFPFNSFCAQSWTHWIALLRLRPRFLTWPFHAMRILQPFRWVHPYGVFPPKTMPAVRGIPLIEVSWDGKQWRECPHQFSPTGPDSVPRFVAPHHPRGDQVAIYEGFGLGDSSIMHSLIGSGQPYGYTKHIGSHVLLQRLLEGHGPSYGNVFFAPGTIPADRPPPRYGRVTTHLLTPTSLEEKRKTGKWWSREYIGPHLAELESDPALWDDIFLEPECFHLEEVVWKRRSRLQEITKAARADQDPHTAVLAGAPELAKHFDAFWNDFVPSVRAQDRSTWDGLPDFVDALRQRYDKHALRALERILGRYTFLLADKLDPLFFDAGFLPIFGLGQPKLEVKSYFHLAMLMHLIIIEGGKEGIERVLATPESANEYVPKLTMASGLYCLGIFRFDICVFEAQKMRLLQAVMEPKRAQFSLSNAELTAKFDEIAKRLFGVVEPYNFLREQFRGARFERGHPERYPSFRLDPSGVVVRDDQTQSTVTS
jgi:Lipase maturation factor